jgi:hypothetical protein
MLLTVLDRPVSHIRTFFFASFVTLICHVFITVRKNRMDSIFDVISLHRVQCAMTALFHIVLNLIRMKLS